MKKIHFPFAVLCALVMPLAALGATATVDGIEWEYDGTTLYGPTDKTLAGDIVIPSSLGGYSVRAIGRAAFEDCTQLTSVTIPEGVTNIGWYAFLRCSSLGNITIPEGVTSFEFASFEHCSSLTNIMIPESVTCIHNDAFRGCSSLESIQLPNSITNFGADTFYGCSNLRCLTIPSAATSIGTWCLRDCTSLTNVVIHNAVTSIGRGAFQNCSSLGAITLPEGLISIGQEAFGGCVGLSKLTIPESVRSIGDNAFANCSNLVEIVALSGNPDIYQAAGLSLSSNTPFITYSELYGAAWNQCDAEINGTVMNYAHERQAVVDMLSVQIRETDPSILDVRYRVTATNRTVNIRALAFEDGERSFAKVVRPETFVDGTGANLGDGVAANVEHTVSWRVSADWAVDLAKVNFEILVSDDGQLPLELVTIPAAETNTEMTINVRRPREDDIFSALLWHYADHAEDLTVSNGALKQGSTTLASGTSVANSSAACAYVYGKMGYDLLSGSELTYARSATRWPLATTTKCQYGVLRASGE